MTCRVCPPSHLLAVTRDLPGPSVLWFRPRSPPGPKAEHVAGHGAAGTALAVHLRLSRRSAVLCGQTRPERPHLLEKVLVAERQDEETHATIVCLEFPPHGRSVRPVGAGHPGLLHRRKAEIG